MRKHLERRHQLSNTARETKGEKKREFSKLGKIRIKSGNLKKKPVRVCIHANNNSLLTEGRRGTRDGIKRWKERESNLLTRRAPLVRTHKKNFSHLSLSPRILHMKNEGERRERGGRRASTACCSMLKGRASAHKCHHHSPACNRIFCPIILANGFSSR